MRNLRYINLQTQILDRPLEHYLGKGQMEMGIGIVINLFVNL